MLRNFPESILFSLRNKEPSRGNLSYTYFSFFPSIYFTESQEFRVPEAESERTRNLSMEVEAKRLPLLRRETQDKFSANSFVLVLLVASKQTFLSPAYKVTIATTQT